MRTPDAVDEVRGAAHEHLLHLEGLLESMHGCEEGGIGTGVTSSAVTGERTGEG